MVSCLARDNLQGHKTHNASGQAVDLVLVELMLCLIVQSTSFMYRYGHLVVLYYCLLFLSFHDYTEAWSQP